jgi:hypothetical protein
VFYIEPKSQNKVDDNGTTKSEKGNVNEVQANGAGANAKLVAQIRAHAKGVFFYVFLYVVHLISAVYFYLHYTLSNAAVSNMFYIDEVNLEILERFHI